MTIRDVLAANFQALRAAHPKLYALPSLASAGGPSNGTSGRILKKESGATIDTVELLAKAFNMEPWQLLVPNMDPAAKPELSERDGSWPFRNITPAQYRQIDPAVRREVEERLVGSYEIMRRNSKQNQSNGQ